MVEYVLGEGAEGGVWFSFGVRGRAKVSVEASYGQTNGVCSTLGSVAGCTGVSSEECRYCLQFAQGFEFHRFRFIGVEDCLQLHLLFKEGGDQGGPEPRGSPFRPIH